MNNLQQIRVHLFGSYSGFNKGDLAILIAMVKQLKAHGNPEIYVSSKYPEVLRRFIQDPQFHPYKTVTSYLGWSTFFYIARADVLVLGGGGLFFERKLWNPFSNHLINLAAVCALNRLFFRKPIAVFAVGASELRSPLARVLTTFVLASAQHISVRDEYTLRLFATCTSKPISLCIDPAFLLIEPLRAHSLLHGRQQRILICINDLVANRYRSGIRQIIDILSSTFEVVIFQNDSGSRSVRSLCAEYATEGISISVLDVAAHSPQEIIQEMTRFDVVVSAPMHAALFAYLAGVPAICIAWDRKVREFCRITGNRYVVDPQHLMHIPEMIRTYQRSDVPDLTQRLQALQECYEQVMTLHTQPKTECGEVARIQ